MPENDIENLEKKEYSGGKNYNQTISQPNLSLNSTLGINMQNLDSNALSGIKNRNRILQDQPQETQKKEEELPKISDIYSDKNFNKEEYENKNDEKTKVGGIKTKKMPPESVVAIITGVLIVVFMILSVVLYNLFTR